MPAERLDPIVQVVDGDEQDVRRGGKGCLLSAVTAACAERGEGQKREDPREPKRAMEDRGRAADSLQARLHARVLCPL